MTVPELRRRLERLPRTPLALLPTPLEPLPALSAALGDVELWIKRDDCTGLALGGNKTRQLEFTVGDALCAGADCLVQGADAQSNHCRQAAAAAARLGLECHLVLHGRAENEPLQGNLLLDRLLGAHLHWTEAELGAPLEAEKEELAQVLRRRGRRPYVIGGERGKMLGAAAYALQCAELAEQCAENGLAPDSLYVCSSGATIAGLLCAVEALRWEVALQAMAPIVWGYDVPAAVARTAAALGAELELEIAPEPTRVRISEEYVGPAYGLPTREGRAAIELVARTEGILLDPCYTGKAMAGLIDHVRRGLVPPGSRVVFIHTGGHPALFRFARELLSG